MKKTIFAALSLLCMVACDNQELNEVPEAVVETAAEGYGYINLRGVGVDTEMVLARAAATADELKGYNITLSKTDGAADTKEYEEITSDFWKRPAGTYTITATNLTVEEAYAGEVGNKGQVRVEGSTTVEVKAGVTNECTINCTPINSKVSFRYTQGFADVFTGTNSVTVSDGARTVPLAMTEGEISSVATAQTGAEDVAYFEADKTLTWNLTATLSNGTAKNYSKTFTTQKAKWTVVTFDASSTDGIINVTITIDDEITDVIYQDEMIDPLN